MTEAAIAAAQPHARFDRDRAIVEARAFDVRRLPPGFIENPFPYYHALREHDPVHRMPDGSYFLTRYADCDAIYRDATRFSSDKKVEFKPKFGDSPLYEHHTTSLVFNDPPLHTHVRRAIGGALTPRAIAEMEGGLIVLVDQLIEAMAQKERVDLIEEFASAIPVEIIGNLLGVPRQERGPLRDWSLAILGALEPVLSEAQLKRGNDAVRDFVVYLEGLVADRRRHPGDPEKDVLTRLIAGEHGGRRLSETELLQNCIFILNAGHETTTNLIGNALYTLLQWPGERRRLLGDPSLMKSAVEEVLRFESSNQLGNRAVAVDVEIGGVKMPKGTLITLCIGAANRDPAQFPDPDRFDIARDPNRHLAFAGGIHICAGMNLARLEGRIAIERFLARFPDYRLDGEPVRSPRARFRGFLSLPARLS
ncbi:MAG: cytochrome P450 [Pseudorhodoplanes sp.]|nr:cytochrome P450 [Pseudorhodoplanes sp.]